MPSLSQFKKELKSLGSPKKAKASAWFFKTAPGQYGAGDLFIGVTVPEQRKVASKYVDLPLSDISKLLHSREHEFRLSALIILVAQYQKASPVKKKEIYNFYLKHMKRINNWDLVDSSASYIVGQYLADKTKMPIIKLAKSKNIWEKRIAMIATLAYIVKGESDTALRIAQMLLKDDHDLIQKAVGWMLREIGKRCSEKTLETFLKKHYRVMPRTMLRYAIERLPPEKRALYLKRK